MTGDSRETKGRARQRERTRRALLAATAQLIERGLVPTVEEAAEAAEVSAATGYRYFPSQGALLQAAVEAAFPPELQRVGELDGPLARLDAVIDNGFPHLVRNEALDRAILELALRQWLQRRAGREPREPAAERPGRIPVVRMIIEPLAGELGDAALRRLELGLGMVMGMESYVALSDIYGLEPDEIRETWRFACRAMIREARAAAARAAA